jgi:hypothetical protein
VVDSAYDGIRVFIISAYCFLPISGLCIQPKSLKTSEVQHIDMATNINVNKMDRRLDKNTWK